MLDAFCGEYPLLALFKNQLSAEGLFVNFGINVKQFERLLVAEGGSIARGASDWDAVGVKGYLIASNGLLRLH